MRKLNPKIALISAGRNNRYGHPHEALLERLTEQGCQIYRTQQSGAVTVRVPHREGVEVRTVMPFE